MPLLLLFYSFFVLFVFLLLLFPFILPSAACGSCKTPLVFRRNLSESCSVFWRKSGLFCGCLNLFFHHIRPTPIHSSFLHVPGASPFHLSLGSSTHWSDFSFLQEILPEIQYNKHFHCSLYKAWLSFFQSMWLCLLSFYSFVDLGPHSIVFKDFPGSVF